MAKKVTTPSTKIEKTNVIDVKAMIAASIAQAGLALKATGKTPPAQKVAKPAAVKPSTTSPMMSKKQIEKAALQAAKDAKFEKDNQPTQEEFTADLMARMPASRLTDPAWEAILPNTYDAYFSDLHDEGMATIDGKVLYGTEWLDLRGFKHSKETLFDDEPMGANVYKGFTAKTKEAGKVIMLIVHDGYSNGLVLAKIEYQKQQAAKAAIKAEAAAIKAEVKATAKATKLAAEAKAQAQAEQAGLNDQMQAKAQAAKVIAHRNAAKVTTPQSPLGAPAPVMASARTTRKPMVAKPAKPAIKKVAKPADKKIKK